MKRRSFIGTSAVGTLGLAAPGSGNAAVRAQAPARVSTLAGKSLKDLREEYRYWLFDDFVPFMDKFVIDHEQGGFMCTVDRDGTQLSSDKRCWYEGRGIWTYSLLYSKLAKEQKYLDVAEKSVKFIMKHKPEGDNLWPENYAKDGTPKGGPDTRLYGDLFVALGLQEFATATGDDSWRRLSKDILLKCTRLYDRPDFQPTAAQSYLGKDAPLIPGARIQGIWFCLLNTLTGMLEARPDAEMEKLAARSVTAIMDYHWNPDFRLTNEIVNHDMTRSPEPISQLVYTGHAIETLWMIMYEAARKKDAKLFSTAAERFRRHVEVAWDDVYGGVYAGLLNVDENRFETNKVLWAQIEVLIGSLFVIEHTGAAWAREWFDRMYTYVITTYPLKKHGLPFWNNQGDRKMTYEPHYNRAENFHHPRHLMLNLLSLDRMIARGGKPSGLFG